MIAGQRVKRKYAPLPDGSWREGVVTEVDEAEELVKIRYDGVYYLNVSPCVNGVNPASQYVHWEYIGDVELVGE